MVPRESALFSQKGRYCCIPVPRAAVTRSRSEERTEAIFRHRKRGRESAVPAGDAGHLFPVRWGATDAGAGRHDAYACGGLTL